MGGDFHYDITPQQSHNLLLIAGGVGINPLMSVLYTVSALETSGNTGQTESRVVLLYSAKSQEELIFKVSVLLWANKLTNTPVTLQVVSPSVRGITWRRNCLPGHLILFEIWCIHHIIGSIIRGYRHWPKCASPSTTV